MISLLEFHNEKYAWSRGYGKHFTRFTQFKANINLHTHVQLFIKKDSMFPENISIQNRRSSLFNKLEKNLFSGIESLTYA